MVQRQQVNAALDCVREFIESLIGSERVVGADHVSRWFDRGSEIDLWFWHEDEGPLYLSNDEAKRYRSTLAALVDAVRSSAQISPRALEIVFRQAILAALDLQDRRSPDSDVRLESAIDALRSSLMAPPQTVRVYHRVNGLAPDGLPTTVGKVEFAVFNDEEVNRFRAAVAEHAVSEEERERRYRRIEKLLQEEDVAGCVVGVVEVAAIESGAAESLAAGELRRTLDVINFYSGLIPYNHAVLSLPGDRDSARKDVLQIVTEGKKRFSFSVNRSLVGRVGELSLPKLKEVDSDRNYGFARVDKLLAMRGRKLEEQIVTSMQWAGRATADLVGGSRREEIFLLYAVALESLILSDHDGAELTYRLCLRVAHLLGSDSASRRELFDDVRRLYGIRSKLVHNGRYQVMDADLSLIRDVTKSTLLQVCTREEFRTMSTPKQLGEWFEDRVLNL
jgi:hypothetical protein